jgi:hypothetical protein
MPMVIIVVLEGLPHILSSICQCSHSVAATVLCCAVHILRKVLCIFHAPARSHHRCMRANLNDSRHYGDRTGPHSVLRIVCMTFLNREWAFVGLAWLSSDKRITVHEQRCKKQCNKHQAV